MQMRVMGTKAMIDVLEMKRIRKTHAETFEKAQMILLGRIWVLSEQRKLLKHFQVTHLREIESDHDRIGERKEKPERERGGRKTKLRIGTM